MTDGSTIDPIAVWANMTLKTWPERYWMIALADTDVELAAKAVADSTGRYACLIRDQGCLSLIVDEAGLEPEELRAKATQKFGPFKVVSTDGELPFNVVGFLRPVLEVLNREGIKAGPQCGADFDHLFIFEKDIDDAQRLLAAFIDKARSQTQQT